MQSRFTQQRLHSIGLKFHYLPESYCLRLLNLKDLEGNDLTLYESDYKKFISYLNKQGLILEKLTVTQKLEAIDKAQVKVIKYFSLDNLMKYELEEKLSDFASEGNIVTTGRVILKKGGHQNCVVMLVDANHEFRIYTYPKVRSIPGKIQNTVLACQDEFEEKALGLVGVSHTSLSKGGKVKFAGSFVHDQARGWIIENTTGHYGTRASNMSLFLEVLQKKDFDLSQLLVKLWIPLDPVHPGIEEKDYTIQYENAALLLERVSRSKNKINDRYLENINGVLGSEERVAANNEGEVMNPQDIDLGRNRSISVG